MWARRHRQLCARACPFPSSSQASHAPTPFDLANPYALRASTRSKRSFATLSCVSTTLLLRDEAREAGARHARLVLRLVSRSIRFFLRFFFRVSVRFFRGGGKGNEGGKGRGSTRGDPKAKRTEVFYVVGGKEGPYPQRKWFSWGMAMEGLFWFDGSDGV